ANQIYEVPNENNNQLLGSDSLQIVHPDLRADALRIDGVLVSGNTLTVQWDVSNAGSSPLTGSWTDSVYLSRDGVIDASDTLLVTRVANRTLDVGAMYTESGSFVLPIDTTG